MKVLMLIDSLDIGGAETHVLLLSSYLNKMGCSVTVASSGGALVERLKQVGVKHIYLPMFNFDKASSKEKFTEQSPTFYLKKIILFKSKLRKIIELERPDVLHAHTRKTAFLASGICKKAHVPLVCTAHAMFSMSLFKNLMSRWGDVTIAVSRDIAIHLTNRTIFKPRQIKIILNGVEIPPPKSNNL